MKYDVFISYSSHDQKVVEGLCAYLEERKIRCFVAYRDIPRGVVWARAIVEALDESRMMVVVFSDHFNQSEQVDREIELASEDKKPILTFRITDDAFKGAKKYYLKNINWIDAFPHPESIFDSVAENVAKLLNVNLPSKTISEPKVEAKPISTHAPAPAKTYKVGDYYNDGIKEGVVFWVDESGEHGKIVSLEQEEIEWCTVSQCYTRIIVGAESQTDGKSNTDKVMAHSDSAEYWAFVWCRNRGKDWYLPAVEELKLLLLDDSVHDAVNSALESRGIINLFSKGENRDYWSSTEEAKYDPFSAKCVSMYKNGSTSYSEKCSTYYVRAVARF